MQGSRWFGALVLVASVSLVTGCGSGDDGSDAASGNNASGGATSSVAKKKRLPRGADTGVGDAEKGKAIFAASCVACHTPDGGAKTGLGKDIVNSEFTASLDDDALMKFIKVGRDAGDPLNTTGVGMPPKGGDPSITAQDLRDLVVFIRSRQAEEGVEHK